MTIERQQQERKENKLNLLYLDKQMQQDQQ
jgi:hypothetical protein